MSDKKVWDWSDFTTTSNGIDLLGNSIRKGISYDAYGSKSNFVAIALTDLFPLTAQQAQGIDGASTGGNSNARYAFRGRIIGQNSPHFFLPDPCDPATTSNPNSKAFNWSLIQMHTLFITSHLDTNMNITRGDKVHVELKPGSVYKYDLQYGRIVGVAAHENPRAAGGECSSLIDLFGRIRAGGGSSIGSRAASTACTPGPLDPAGRPTCIRTSPRIGEYVTWDNKTLDSLHTDARTQFDGFKNMIECWGYTFEVTSAKRSIRHQFDLYLSYRGTGVALPCLSNHQYGAAIDVIIKGPGIATSADCGGNIKTCAQYKIDINRDVVPYLDGRGPSVTDCEIDSSAVGRPLGIDVVFGSVGRGGTGMAHDTVHWEYAGAEKVRTWDSPTAQGTGGGAKQKCIDYYYNGGINADDPTWPVAKLGDPGTVPSNAAMIRAVAKWPRQWNIDEDFSIIQSMYGP